MLKILKNDKIKSRIFKNFQWPNDLPTFKSKNLIYGWNGTGKSTLSDLFRLIEKKCSSAEDSFTINIEDQSIDSSSFSEKSSLPSVKVFSKKYIEENVFNPEEGVKAIFYLGQENIEKQKRVEELKSKINNLKSEINEKTPKKNNQKKELKDYLVNKAKEIKTDLSSSGSENKYNNYDKSNFEKKADSFSPLLDEEIKEKILDDKAYRELKSNTLTPLSIFAK